MVKKILSLASNPRYSFSWLAGLGLLQVILHCDFLNLPPAGFHQWRQAHTLAVARNFHEESMNLFLPRIDGRGAESGITGMEFPLVNYTIALGYRIFGEHDWVGRGTLLLFSLLALFFAFHFFRQLFSSPLMGLLGVFSLIFSPLFMYYSAVVIPDPASLALVFAFLYLLLRWEAEEKPAYFYGALGFLLLAGLIKVSALMYGPLMAFFLFRKKSWMGLLLAAGVVVLVGGWYAYANYLSFLHHNFDFKLHPAMAWDVRMFLRVARKVFTQWLPELYLNYAQFGFFVAGLFMLARKKMTLPPKTGQIIRWMGLCTGVYLLSMFPQFEIHDYYMILALPFLISLVILGMKSLADRAVQTRFGSRWLIAALLLVMVLGMGRALPRFRQRSPELEKIGPYLASLHLPDKALFIAASDDSPCIYLYFMHKKGWAVREDVNGEAFQTMVLQGAQYLVSDSRAFEKRPEISRFLEPFSENSAFKVFKIRKISS